MIEILVPELKEYDTKNASTLALEIINLHTFNEIIEWDRKAVVEIDTMRTSLRNINGILKNIEQGVEKEKQEHESKNFISRIFDGRKEHNRLLEEQSRLVKETRSIEELINQFEVTIDFTPNSTEDLKELLKECKQRKKELQTEKKSVVAQMTSIRVDARQRSADTIRGKYGTWERRNIQFNKEVALKPHETEKSAIERQIIKLEKIILWLERFK